MTTYDISNSDNASKARSIMEKKIAEGRASAAGLFERVHQAVPADQVVRGRALNFLVGGAQGTDLMMAPGGGVSQGIHRHALGQMAGKAGIPGAYLAELATSTGPWQAALAAHTLNEHFTRGEAATRYLTRSINGQVRGFLSDRYRRLDSRPLLDAFATSCQAVGAVPVDGTASDTRVAMKAMLPHVFEPVPGEVMCLGVEWGNSDFGAARHTVRAFILRLWCLNGATMEDTMAQVHLGRQLNDDIEFSKATYQLDMRASVSALGDVVKGLLSPAKVNNLVEGIRRADANKVEWKKVRTQLAKKLLKGELDAVEAAFQSEDVINLPAGQSVWRASNAVSWIAGKTEDQDRRLELQRAAGWVLDGKTDAAADAA